MWVQTPTFLYRNCLYQRLINGFSKRGEFLLIGTGSGEFIKTLVDMGFRGTAIDISSSSVTATKKSLGKIKGITIKKADIFSYRPGKKFDCIFCFEVLEHLKDDSIALRRIYNLLRPGGFFVLSVPAHMSLWAKIDEIGGHFRRYEQSELKAKLKKAGFRIKTFWSYGFPFLRLVRLISQSGVFVKNFHFEESALERSKKSGIRTEYSPQLKPLVTFPALLKPAFWLMDLFLQTDLGLGYIVVARRK